MGTLYVVSTPIGNLQDLTPRAREVLGQVAHLLAEDTRRTGRLLQHLGLDVPLLSLHAHNEAQRVTRVLAWLDQGEAVALVSDAGTPLVSDPGRRVVEAAIGAGHRVVPIPGASAPLAALVASGLAGDRFAFLGFTPRKGPDRRSTLERVAGSMETTVLFESPERLASLLDELRAACGHDRRAAVARELTKLHEEVRRGTLDELFGYYEEHPPRGEVTLVVAPHEPGPDDDEARRAVARDLARELLAGGGSPSRIAREVAKRVGIPRNDAYALVQEMNDMTPGTTGGAAES